MSSPAKTHSRLSREHPVGALFICLSVLEMKKTKKTKQNKKQYYTFNNSSVLQMLGKDHVLLLKKIKIF